MELNERRHSAESHDPGHGGLQILVTAGPIRFAADEPVKEGGLDLGPSPHDLVSAGLAACTTMTLRVYAKQKGWPLANVHVTVDRQRDPTAKPADLFIREITLEGELDDTQRNSLLEIANRCPIHRLLESGVRIETSLASSGS
jgi:putative redox protein